MELYFYYYATSEMNQENKIKYLLEAIDCKWMFFSVSLSNFNLLEMINWLFSELGDTYGAIFSFSSYILSKYKKFCEHKIHSSSKCIFVKAVHVHTKQKKTVQHKNRSTTQLATLERNAIRIRL